MEVLEYTELPRIPDEYNEDGPIWVKAIALVLTRTNSHSYAIVHNDAGATPTVVKTFDASGVSKVLGIYPYEYLPEGAIPAFKNVQEARTFVTKAYGADPETVKGMSKAQLLKAILRIALRRHLAAKGSTENPKLQPTRNNIQADNE